MARIVVYGSLNMDLVVTTPVIPRPGQTVTGSDFATVPGGKGANQAVACARLGAQTAIAGSVGEDAFGSQLLQTLQAAGVDTCRVRREPATPTGIALIMVEASGQNSIVVAPGANGKNDPGHVGALAPLLEEADALLLQLEVPLPALEAVMRAGRQAGVRVILDAGPARKLAPALLALADVVSPNETETAALTGIEVDSAAAAARAAAALREQGCRSVVLKLGARGCLVHEDRGTQHLPAIKVSPVDTTAAGDAFTAALAVALCEGAGLVEAARFANYAGALATTVFGAQPSMPTRAALEAFIKERSCA